MFAVDRKSLSAGMPDSAPGGIAATVTGIPAARLSAGSSSPPPGAETKPSRSNIPARDGRLRADLKKALSPLTRA